MTATKRHKRKAAGAAVALREPVSAYVWERAEYKDATEAMLRSPEYGRLLLALGKAVEALALLTDVAREGHGPGCGCPVCDWFAEFAYFETLTEDLPALVSVLGLYSNLVLNCIPNSIRTQ
jgi:hypothetical protein